MDIIIRLEEEKDYHRVEEITKIAFSYPERIERGKIGCPYEHWMVNELVLCQDLVQNKMRGFAS